MKNTFVTTLLLAGLLLSFSGCFKDPEPQPCTYDACAAKAPASEIQRVQDYLTANNITATQHCSGLFYRIEQAGTGATPEYCGDVTARYKGMFTDGTTFDDGTAVFNLMGVIRGWTNGVPLVKQGGRIHLYIPPSLGYGSQDYRDPYTGALIIPGNSTLVFEVDLLEVH